MVEHNAIIRINTIWSQSQSPVNNANVSTVDNGEIVYQHEYPSGSGDAEIDEIFYETNQIDVSGESKRYDLLDLTGEVLGHVTNQSFSSVNSITIKNLSTGNPVHVVLDEGNSFGGFFGDPTEDIILHPSSMIHLNNSGSGYPVSSGEQDIRILNNDGSGCIYELVIIGNQ